MTTQRSAALIVLFATLVAARAAQGQQRGETPPASDDNLVDAGAHLKQGKAFFDTHLYAEAIREFEASYAIVPNPAIQFSIAEAYQLAGDSKQALASYKKYLALVHETELTDTARTQVAKLTKELADASDTKRKSWDAERDRRRHGRLVGNIFIWGVGVGGAALASIVGAAGGQAGVGIGVGAGLLVIGLGYGIPKRLLNSDPGELKVSASVAHGDVKSLVLSGRF